VETLYAEYVALRAGGLRAADAIESLRERIEVLLPTDKLSLVRAVRAYEEQAVRAVTAQLRPAPMAPAVLEGEPPREPTIEDLAARAVEEGETTIKLPENLRKQHEARVQSALTAVESAEDEDELYTPCPNCGNPVLVSMLQCPTCYFVMPAAGPKVETVESARGPLVEPAPAQFRESLTLVMTSRDGRRVFSRPQDSRREMVVGRTDGKTFTADLDLGPLDASTLGVSRVHAALVYDAPREVLRIMDLNSMNGTFLNGLRLKPQEMHDLRPGDLLRLGRLTVRVSYDER